MHAQPDDADDAPRIGAYRLIRELGNGGMGVVYLAERADGRYRRQVAVKLLHRGLRPELRLRFHQEGKVLAELEHPNIARLYDSDTAADGRPFLVMEYVEGLPILEFCDRHRLSIEDRLRLFRKVCAAVQYAHQRLVVHRDLKPDNILVTGDGEPKLLDFGIAKLLDRVPEGSGRTLTRPGFGPMTPRYASPEQVHGEAVTTASDTYSLGVLLYELLVGRRPYRLRGGSPLELERAICGQTPDPPSIALGRAAAEPGGAAVLASRGGRLGEVRRRLRGDLDHVVVKALRKDPAARYRSVEALSEDLGRYLEGMPVTARAPSLGYRGGKFLHRHRFGLGVLTAVAALCASFAVAFVRQAREVERERDLAQRSLEFLVDVFGVDPNRQGGDSITARQILDAGAERVKHDFAEQPRVQATLFDAIGRIYFGLGLYDEAAPLVERALEMRRELYGGTRLEVAESLQHLGEFRHEQRDEGAAEALFREALAVRRASPGDGLAVAESLNGLAKTLRFSGHFRGADVEAIHREALEIRQRVLGPSHPAIAESLDSLGGLYFRRGDYERAAELYGQASAMYRRELGTDHPDTAMSLKDLGLALGSQGHLDRAEELISAALDVLRRTLGEEHNWTVEALRNLAWVRLTKGDFAGAEEPVRQSLTLLRRRLAEDHPDILMCRYYLGMIYIELGKLEAAEAIVPATVEMARERMGGAHPTYGHMVYSLGSLRRKQGRIDEAEKIFTESLEILDRAYPDGHELTADPLLGLGRVDMARGNPVAAEPRFRRALDLLRPAGMEMSWPAAEAALELGACLTALGRYEEAEPLLRQSYELLAAHFGEDDEWAARARKSLSELYRSQGIPAAQLDSGSAARPASPPPPSDGAPPPTVE